MIKKPIGPKRDELKISEEEEQRLVWYDCDAPEFKEEIKESKEFMEIGKIMQSPRFDDITAIKEEKE